MMATRERGLGIGRLPITIRATCRCGTSWTERFRPEEPIIPVCPACGGRECRTSDETEADPNG